MDRDRTSPGNDTKCLGYGIANAPKGSADVRNHPQRIQGLTRRLERQRDELGELRREAITSVEKTIGILGSQQPGMTVGVAGSLLSELEWALNELRCLNIDDSPQQKRFFTVAGRLTELSKILATSAAAYSEYLEIPGSSDSHLPPPGREGTETNRV